MKYNLNYKLDKNNFIYDLLQHKGIQDIDLFLNYNESCEENVYHLDNMQKGIQILYAQLQNKNKLNIVVDCDLDGFVSCTLFYFFLKYIEYPEDKYNFIFHGDKFHGIRIEELDDDCDFLIAPDCGTSDYEQHAQLNKKGIKILVLDHHEALEGYSTSPNVTTINNQLSTLYDNKYLCGAGVTFKFLKEYCKQYYPDLDMNQYLDLVAIAIIGDVMNLSTLENRYYVDKGLHNIQNPFFKALVEKRAFSIGSNIPTPTDVAFYLVPAINAIIRMSDKEEQKTLFQAIVEGDREVPSTKRGHKPDDIEIAKEQAIRLCDNAIARQRRERTKIAELLQDRIAEQGWENDKIIIGQYYDSDNINSNLTGLAAMELASYYQRPALVVHYDKVEDSWSGSARNFGSAISDLKQFLEDSGLFEYCAGHAGAFGEKFHNKDLQAIREYCNTKLANINYTTDNMYYVDYETTPDDINLMTIIAQIDKWKNIWGHGIEEPLICVKNIPVYGKEILVMGNNGDSFKFSKNGIAYVRFKDMDFYNNIACDDDIKYLTVVGKANINHWNGINAPQLMIQDYNIESIYDF